MTLENPLFYVKYIREDISHLSEEEHTKLLEEMDLDHQAMARTLSYSIKNPDVIPSLICRLVEIQKQELEKRALKSEENFREAELVALELSYLQFVKRPKYKDTIRERAISFLRKITWRCNLLSEIEENLPRSSEEIQKEVLSSEMLEI